MACLSEERLPEETLSPDEPPYIHSPIRPGPWKMIKPRLSSRTSGLRTTATLVAVVAGLYFARDVLIPMAFALTLALILSPPVARLQKLRVGRRGRHINATGFCGRRL